MSLLKQIPDKGAVLAWSPVKAYGAVLATGTKEGGGGGFDDYGGELSLHSIDLSNHTLDTRILGSLKTPTRFSSLAWGNPGSSQTSVQAGLIVGGMSDGSINVWDAGSLMSGMGESSTLAVIERHQAAVRAIQFNPNPGSTHLLAAGSVDGDISVVNLETVGTPTVASPFSGAQRLEAEVSALAWNTAVPYILATSTPAGVVAVWDLKENKPWCRLQDPQRSAIADLCWHPTDGLYLVTACDDDARPVLRVWDLRSSTTSPLCEFAGHTKGILSVDWCPHDPNLIVSCGKDSHTFIWDLQQGRAVADIPAGPASAAGSSSRDLGLGAGSHGMGGADPFSMPPPAAAPVSAASIFGSGPVGVLGAGAEAAGGVFGSSMGGIGAGAGRRYNVRWSRCVPALLSACSFDRKVTVHSVAAVGPGTAPKLPGMATAPPEAVAASVRRAPSWLRRPVGATWGFGGKLITFRAPPAAQKSDLRAGTADYAKLVRIFPIHTDAGLVSQADALQHTITELEAGGADAAAAFCGNKAAAAGAAGDAVSSNEWALMSHLFYPDVRQRVLGHLGLHASTVVPAALVAAGAANMLLPEQNEALQHALAAGTGSEAHHHHHQEALPAAAEAAEAAPSARPARLSAADLFGGPSPGPTPVSALDFFSGSAGAAATAEEAAPEPVATPVVAAPKAAAPAAAAEDDDAHATFEPRRVPSAANDSLLMRALLSGDFAAAVSVALKQSRYEEALLLASCGGGDLWRATQATVLARHRAGSVVTSTLGAVVTGDLATYVATAPLEASAPGLGGWQQVLATLCSFSKAEEFGSLCEVLGDRLLAVNDQAAAVSVYLAAMADTKVTTVWVHQARVKARSMGLPAALHELVEKTLVLRHAVLLATGQRGPLPHPEASLLAEYCALLANEGYHSLAAFVAGRIQDPPAPSSPVYPGASATSEFTPEYLASLTGVGIRDRVLRGMPPVEFMHSPVAQSLVQITPYPYTVPNVGVAPVAAPVPVAPTMSPPAPVAAPVATSMAAPAGAAGVPGAYGGGLGMGGAGAGYGASQYASPVRSGPGVMGGAPQQPQQQMPQQAAPMAAPGPRPSSVGYSGAYGGAGGVGAPVPGPVPAAAARRPSVQPHPMQHAAPVAPGPAAGGYPTHAAAGYGAPQPAAGGYGAPTPAAGGYGGMPPAAPVPAAPAPRPVAPVAAPAPAPAPAAPLPISPEMQAVLDTLAGTVAVFHSSGPLSTVESKQLAEASTDIDLLRTRLSEGRIPPEVQGKLQGLAHALASYDWLAAQRVQVDLANAHWAHVKDWQRGVRNMVALAIKKAGLGGATR